MQGGYVSGGHRHEYIAVPPDEHERGRTRRRLIMAWALWWRSSSQWHYAWRNHLLPRSSLASAPFSWRRASDHPLPRPAGGGTWGSLVHITASAITATYSYLAPHTWLDLISAPWTHPRGAPSPPADSRAFFFFSLFGTTGAWDPRSLWGRPSLMPTSLFRLGLRSGRLSRQVSGFAAEYEKERRRDLLNQRRGAPCTRG